MRSQRRVRIASIVLGLSIATAQPALAAAQVDGHGGHGGHGPRVDIDVVAEGLDTPRGVFYDKRNHRVLVAEAGQLDGNNGPCGTGNSGVVYCYGETGAITEYSERGHHQTRRIVTGLPSIRAQDNTTVLGVHDLAYVNGQLKLVFGLSGNASTFRAGLVAQGATNAATLATMAIVNNAGRAVPFADFGTWEVANNPDGRRIDSDPYSILIDERGTVVADPAGNDIVQVNPDGSLSLLVYLPARDFMGDPDYESVPISVLRGRDGALYIGELTGVPYHPGSARVLRAMPGQAPTVFAEGFTNIIDLAWDDRGRLLVLQAAKDGLILPPDTVTGRLVRIECDGTQTELITTGLENPGGIAVAGHNEFYVTNRTTSTGDVGQLLHIRIHGE